MHPSLGDRALYKRHCLAWSRKGCADLSICPTALAALRCSPGRCSGGTGRAGHSRPERARWRVVLPGGYNHPDAGRYTVHEGRVLHHVETSLFPNWVGGAQERRYKLDGDRLPLSTAPLLQGGRERRALLVWERAGGR